MKSAEDWIEYWAHWLRPDERKVAALALKERDLENYRAGMTEAAGIAYKGMCRDGAECDDPICQTARTIGLSIEQARDRKTVEEM